MATLQPIFDTLKPEGDSGFVHAGSVGAGHFAKMVHNGIEYAIMQAYAEGWELLQKVEEVENVTEVFDSWRSGTVIRSWLLDLLVAALKEDDKLDQIAGYAEDSGEGRWTVEAAIDNAVPLARDHRRVVRPLPVTPRRIAGHEGDRGDAQPVRRPRSQGREGRHRTADVVTVATAVVLHVSQLALIDFRSYEHAEIAIPVGVSAFIGPNGQGKTNLVEAIDYVSTQSSHRVASDQPLVRFGADQAIVRTAVQRDDRQALIELQINPGLGEPGPAQPRRCPASPRSARDLAHGAVRP